ncbi:MAG: hypothetical protein U0414_31800 [Polyangiaceae bacterium]
MSKWRISVDPDGTIRAASSARWVRHELPGGPIFVKATAADGGDAAIVVTEHERVSVPEPEPAPAPEVVAVAPAVRQARVEPQSSRFESYLAARKIALRQAASPLAYFDRWTIILELLLPKRVLGEELGDAREQVIRYLAKGGGVWGVRVKLMTTVFWLLVNSAREVASAVLSKTPDRRKSG